MTDMENVISKLDELRQLADTEIHPIVSPDNWYVYSKLCDLIDLTKADILDMLKEQDELLHKKQKDIDRLCNEISEWKQKYHNKLLKEQEPVKVKDCADIVDGIQVGYCPKCNRKIVWNPEKEETVAFCKYCGKKVKWNEP